MTSVVSISIWYFFFKFLINSSTSISGADAPDEIPIVLQASILSNGISLSEWISKEFITELTITDKNKFKIVLNDYLNISKSLVSEKETKLINAIIQKYIDKDEINKK